MTISDFDKCANCGLCVSLCPNGAIYIDKDSLFYTPVVDKDKCVDCGLCSKRCPVNHPIRTPDTIAAYFTKHREPEIVKKSSSGGAFSALADDVIKDGGVVFSAGYSQDHRSVVFLSSDETPIDNIRRSKYVESLTQDAFERVEKALSAKRRVLFCGTPCQVAGLKSYLNKEYSALLCCDFICGGLPSHKLYAEYLDDLSRRYNSRITGVNFRPKTFGWREYAMRVTFENGKTYDKQACFDPYLSAFIHRHVSIRDYCHECKFPSFHQSDITLADFWLYPQLTGRRDDSGVSLLLVHTEKGMASLEKTRSDLELNRVELTQLKYACVPHKMSEATAKLRKLYFDEYAANGVVSAGRKYCTVKGKAAVRARLRGSIRKKRFSGRRSAPR